MGEGWSLVTCHRYPAQPDGRGAASTTGPRFCHDAAVGVTPQQFEEMKSRLSGARRAATAILPPTAPAKLVRHEVILGIDPSLRATGYGVIRVAKPRPLTLGYGVVPCPAGWEPSRCLARIAQTIRDVIREFHPSVCVVEGLFYAQNLQTALAMGQARGASLVAAAEAGLEVYEIAPRRVKQAIVGYGGAGKEAVAKMVQRMLHLKEVPAADAADALALALAHAQEQGRYALTPLKRI
jgi:crossover junction endodeoxyribonuclease RuvC